jgi:hypothetical protein
MKTSPELLRIEKAPPFKPCKYRMAAREGEGLCTFFDGTIGECAPERCLMLRRRRE